ncbi:MAG: hypothetical protein U0W40_09340 [Acidimicrobiia bacterium]
MPQRDNVAPDVTAVVVQHGAQTSDHVEPIGTITPVGPLGASAGEQRAPGAARSSRSWPHWPSARRDRLAGGAFGTSTPSEQAQQLLTRMRQASDTHDFTGVATVSWRDGSTRRTAEVEVSDADGTVEARVDGNVVYDSGDRTYVKDDGRWTGIAVESGGRDAARQLQLELPPAPDP